MILIYSTQENVQVGLPAGYFGGEQVSVPNPNASRRLDDWQPPPVLIGSSWVEARTYVGDGHFLAVDGEDALMVSHDAERILALGADFRLANASEQNSYTAAQQAKTGALKENGKSNGDGGSGKAGKTAAAAENGG